MPTEAPNSNESLETTATNEPETEALEADDEATDWKAKYLAEKQYARKWEDRSKYNKKELEAIEEKARKFEEYQESLKTEAEKQAEELARFRAEAETARIELAKLKVATSRGLDPKALKFISGTTEEEIEAAADELAALIASDSKPTINVAPVRTQGLSGNQTATTPEAAWADVWNNRNR